MSIIYKDWGYNKSVKMCLSNIHLIKEQSVLPKTCEVQYAPHKHPTM